MRCPASIVGLLVGQTGVGGGSMMTPLLVLVFGIHPATAVGSDLLYASATKTAGSLVHGANRNVDWRLTGRLACGSLPATAITLYLVSRYDLFGERSAHVLSIVLGCVLVVTALSLIFRQQRAGLPSPPCWASPRRGRRRSSRS